MRGFTLLEVMIVALLVALMGVMSWRVMESMVRSQGILKARGEALEETQFFFNQWHRDCQALLPPAQWRSGPPVWIGAQGMAWLIHTPDGVYRVGYGWVNGALHRVERGPLATRDDWQADWQTVTEGGPMTGRVSDLTLPGATGMQARAWLNQGWATQVKGVPGGLVRGLEWDITLAGTAIPLRQVCLTGQD